MLSAPTTDHQRATLELRLQRKKAVKVKIMNLVRTAVHDIVPSENPKGRFMYWDQRDPDAIVDMFWARHGAELGAEVSWAGSKEALLFKYRQKIRETACQEKF